MLNKRAGINLSTETIVMLIILLIVLVVLVLILTGAFGDISTTLGAKLKSILGLANSTGINP